MTVSAIFTDGSMVQGESYHALELALRSDEWNQSDKEKFRLEMGKRAWVWSQTDVDEEATSRLFLRGLEQAGIMRIEEEAT